MSETVHLFRYAGDPETRERPVSDIAKVVDGSEVIPRFTRGFTEMNQGFRYAASIGETQPNLIGTVKEGTFIPVSKETRQPA